MQPKAPTKADIKEAIEDQSIIDRTDVSMETRDLPDDDEAHETKLLNYDTEQIARLTEEVFRYYESLKQDRSENDNKWEGYEAQYEGTMTGDSQLEFNLNVPVTMVKCDALERLANRAFLESDPKFAVQLRPEAMRAGMDQSEIERIEKTQEDYLDYQLDERIDIDTPLRMTLHEAVKLEGGFMKVPYVYRRKRRTRTEFYSGKPVPVEGEEGVLKPEGLESFLQNYPTAKLPGEPGYEYFQKLSKFKDVSFEAKYWSTVYDDAKPTFVAARDFLASKTAEGYAGLCDEKILIETTRYKYWEMEKKEQAKEFINVEKMKFSDADGKNADKEYDLKDHEVLEVTYHFKENKDDDEEAKIICYFGRENKVFLGAEEYPYHLVDCIYVPFYITKKRKGLYQPGLPAILTDSHLAQNAMLNLMLTESWLDLITTPIVREGSTVATQILSGRWSSGVPLVIGAKENFKEELDFVPKPQRNVAGQLINMLMFLGRQDDQRTGISDLSSGRETPMDPNAPAAKVAMLLKQSGINIEDYINCLRPSFDLVAEIILKLTYQMSNSGRRYRHRQRAQRVTGREPFGMISRDDMILETVIESRAAGFAFDKATQKQENVLLFQLLRNEPLIAQNPKAAREMVKSLLTSWSNVWKTKADQLVLTSEQMDEEVMKAGLKALNIYMQDLTGKAKTTGVAPKPDLKEYLSITAGLMSQIVNGPPEEAKKK